MSAAITPPTPENVAELLTEGDNDLHDGNGWKPGLSATGNVVRISITPYDEDGNALDDVHFRAVVVGVPAHTVASEPVKLPADLARDLACCGPDDDPIDGWTVVANEYLESHRWESLHELVIRNGDGQHFMDTYRQGLTERQDTGPYEYEKTATFTPVVPKFKVVTEWASAAQSGGAA